MIGILLFIVSTPASILIFFENLKNKIIENKKLKEILIATYLIYNHIDTKIKYNYNKVKQLCSPYYNIVITNPYVIKFFEYLSILEYIILYNQSRKLVIPNENNKSVVHPRIGLWFYNKTHKLFGYKLKTLAVCSNLSNPYTLTHYNDVKSKIINPPWMILQILNQDRTVNNTIKHRFLLNMNDICFSIDKNIISKDFVLYYLSTYNDIELPNDTIFNILCKNSNGALINVNLNDNYIEICNNYCNIHPIIVSDLID